MWAAWQILPYTADFLFEAVKWRPRKKSIPLIELTTEISLESEIGAKRSLYCSVPSLLKCWAVPANHEGKKRSPDTQPSLASNLHCITIFASVPSGLTWLSSFTSTYISPFNSRLLGHPSSFNFNPHRILLISFSVPVLILSYSLKSF